jgi:hypothetical protein
MKVVLTLDLPSEIAQMIESDQTVKSKVEEWIETKYIAETTKSAIIRHILGNNSTTISERKDTIHE